MGFGNVGAMAGLGAGAALNPAALLATAGSVGSLASQAFNAWQQHQNYDAARAAQDWAQYQQINTWNREDTAVQRRVADLRAAGLSPVLAAGSAASSGPVVTMKPAQREMLSDPSVNVMNMIRMTQDMLTSASQRELIEQQTRNAQTQEMVLDQKNVFFVMMLTFTNVLECPQMLLVFQKI